MNVVMTGGGELVEVQATGEGVTVLPASRWTSCSASRRSGIEELRDAQEAATAGAGVAGVAPAARAGPSADATSCSRPGTMHKLRELEAMLAPHTLQPLPGGVELPPEDGDDVRGERADQGPRRRRRDRARRRSPTTPGSPSRRSAARPGIHSARYAGEDATDEENLAKLIAATCRTSRTGGRPTSACSRSPRPGGAERTLRGPLRGRARRAAPRGDGRLRLRPDLRGGRALRGRTARWPSSHRARSTRSATAAAPRASSPSGSGGDGRRARPAGERHRATAALRRSPRPRSRARKAGAARLSIVSNSALILLKIVAGAVTGSIAIITEAVHSSIDLLASIVAYFSVRKADEPADEEPHVRAREGREPRGGDRGHADPGRRRRDRFRGGPAPGERQRRGRARRLRHRRDRDLDRGQRRASPPTSTARPRSTTRRRWRATPPTCAPTRSPRSRCSSGWC